MTNTKQKTCDAINRQWLMECVNEGWIKFDTEKDKNRFIHLVRDMAPPVTPQSKSEDIAKAFQMGLAIGFGERYDELDRVIDEIKKVITPQPNIGYWREVDKNEYACSNCNHTFSIVPEDNSIEEYKYCPNCKSKNRYEGNIDGMTGDVKTFYDGEYEVKAKIVNRGNCMMCGKELSDGEGIFFCKECAETNLEKSEVKG